MVITGLPVEYTRREHRRRTKGDRSRCEDWRNRGKESWERGDNGSEEGKETEEKASGGRGMVPGRF